MAKRKAARRRAAPRKAATTRRKVGRTRSAGKKTAARKKAASARKKTASARKRTVSARKATASRKTASARKTGARKTRRASPPAARKRTAPVAKKTAAPAKKTAARVERVPVRTAPGLNRERRTIRDDDIVQTPPSSLDFDRSASSARSGRRELREKYNEHTETGPALTGGDVDADWESAYSVGDEAPGGDNPTPDQDVVDEIGRAVGVEYQDNEELKGEAKISKRDRNRWELDPASSDDWDER
jgi:Family of unknown function (DUF6335)